MTLQETLNASEVLRRYTMCFDRCTRAGKHIEARTYLPNIRKACEELNMNWREVLGIENERFFTDNERIINRSLSDQLTEQIPEITVQRDINRSLTVHLDECLNCQNSLKGKRKGAKYCSDNCKNSHRKNVDN